MFTPRTGAPLHAWSSAVQRASTRFALQRRAACPRSSPPPNAARPSAAGWVPASSQLRPRRARSSRSRRGQRGEHSRFSLPLCCSHQCRAAAVTGLAWGRRRRRRAPAALGRSVAPRSNCSESCSERGRPTNQGGLRLQRALRVQILPTTTTTTTTRAAHRASGEPGLIATARSHTRAHENGSSDCCTAANAKSTLQGAKGSPSASSRGAFPSPGPPA